MAEKSVRVRALIPIGGVNFSLSPGDFTSFPLSEAKRMEAAGAVEIVGTKLADLRRMARELGYDLVPQGEAGLEVLGTLARAIGYNLQYSGGE